MRIMLKVQIYVCNSQLDNYLRLSSFNDNVLKKKENDFFTQRLHNSVIFFMDDDNEYTNLSLKGSDLLPDLVV